ncbi:MAG TPA: hypothetical protein VNC41_03540 [Acidimicrobiia bacterium]|nr:hypothetical protein [Acidimicrobiia bacterium]
MARLTPAARRCRRRFLEFFPDGFDDETYRETERAYKWDAHRRWRSELDRRGFESLLDAGAFDKIADHAIRVESRTNLLFSFEKMAVRDAVRSGGAQPFAEGLYDWLHGAGPLRMRFDRWIATLDALPRRQTRVVTWPVATVWGFIARPRVHIFLKPTVTRIAAEAYGVPFDYRSRPQWNTYRDLLAFAARIRDDQADLRPRDMIDVQSFIWVQGSAEYD